MEEDELDDNEYYKDVNLKSFIRVGLTFIDIKETIGFSFMKDPEGYIIVQFVYESGRGLNAYLRNRSDFSHFLLQLDTFVDDEKTVPSIKAFIKEVEKELGM